MIFLAMVGFIVLFALGAVFIITGAGLLLWSVANKRRDFTPLIPISIGCGLIYLSLVTAPFSVVLSR